MRFQRRLVFRQRFLAAFQLLAYPLLPLMELHQLGLHSVEVLRCGVFARSPAFELDRDILRSLSILVRLDTHALKLCTKLLPSCFQGGPFLAERL